MLRRGSWQASDSKSIPRHRGPRCHRAMGRRPARIQNEVDGLPRDQLLLASSPSSNCICTSRAMATRRSRGALPSSRQWNSS